MLITLLELENIKSYRRQVITLTEGLNAVCGLNGSGKTTILEAIGFALFDSLPYKQQAFVREGEKTGTVRVRLLDRDGREYEVVRRVGSSSVCHVSDVETGMKLADNRESVETWIKEHALGIDGDADLRALFENAVGVPQGQITAGFLQRPTQRKDIFAPLLRVEEYEAAWENLRDAERHLREERARLDGQIESLEKETEAMPECEAAVDALQDQLRVSEEGIAALAAELTDIKDRKSVLDTIEEALAVAGRALSEREAEAARYQSLLPDRRQELAAALEAGRIVDESREGHRLYQEAAARADELERQNQEYERLREAINDVKTVQKGIFGRIEQLDKQRTEAIEARDGVAALEEGAARQRGLTEELHAARARNVELAAQLQRLERDIVALERDLTGRLAEVERARAAGERVAELAAVEEEVRQIGDDLAAMEPIRRQVRELEVEGKRLREQHDRLTAEARRHDDLLSQLSPVQAEADLLDGLQSEHQELRDRQARIAATIEYREIAGADLSRKHCPLLDLECPAVSDNPSLLDRLTGGADQLTGQLQEVRARIADLGPRVEAARQAAQHAQQLAVDLARVGDSGERLEEVTGELGRCRTQYRELAEVLGSEKDLGRRQAELRVRRDDLRKEQEAAMQLPSLQARLQETAERLEAQRTELAGRKSEQSEAGGLLGRLQADLDALGDPQAQQERLRGRAQYLPTIERSLEMEQRELDRHTDRLKVLVAESQQFQMVREQLEEQRAIRTRYEGAYVAYVANEAKAAELKERRRLVDETEQSLALAQAAVEEAAAEKTAIEATYDAALHEQLKERYQDLDKSMAVESERHEGLLRELERAEDQLSRLQRQQELLEQRRAEREELERTSMALGFIRDTIRAAGPAVTETLLSNISLLANEIYADIMDDHAVELRWNRDYEIIVQRGAEERHFPQLSGGEQMSAALAVRLALLKEMSEVDVAFFDEPTQNMDSDRRGNLAEQIRQVKGFNQLVVISHDDTFEHHTDNLIRLAKVGEETQLES